MTTIPRRLSQPEARAVRHLLARSALADCQGTLGRIVLTDDNDLTVQHLDSWSWSNGEEVLLDVLRHILGEARWPDLSKIDDHNQLVVRESMRLLCREGVSA